MAAPLAPLTAAAVLRLGSRGLRHRHRHRILLASLRPCSSAPQPNRFAVVAAARRLPTPPPPPRRLARTLAASAATAVSEAQTDMCKVKNMGLRFADLLDRLSLEYPEMRFRFTSPHPKDFPDELLYLMRDRYNICNLIHLPAQTGSTAVLERMRRGYTREAYLELVHKIRNVIPDVGLSSDFITGFCGETEDDHAETLSLVRAVGYDMAYMFAYSMREKTHAHRNYEDDVPEDVKQRRLMELINTFRETTKKNYDSQIGTVQLVLVEGPNKRAPKTELIGKTDRGHKVSFASVPIPHTFEGEEARKPVVGDFVEVKILRSSTATLFGEPIARTSLSVFHKNVASEAQAVAA